MSGPLEQFVAAGPAHQRVVVRVLLAVGRRPRGRVLLRLAPPLDQAVGGMLAMEHFDDPRVSAELGWDPEAVVARARAARG
ncbi:MAG: hypothetical protein ACJ762_02890 [Solirubrobacteraceae bacterium]